MVRGGTSAAAGAGGNHRGGAPETVDEPSDDSVIIISSDDEGHEPVVVSSSDEGDDVQSRLGSLERHRRAQHSAAEGSDSDPDSSDTADSEARYSAFALHDEDLLQRHRDGPLRSMDPAVRRYMSYAHDDPLSTGLIHAAISSQPPLPQAARDALPFPEHRQEVDGRPLLRCHKLPENLPPNMLMSQTTGPVPFCSGLLNRRVELGHFQLPLVRWDPFPDTSGASGSSTSSPPQSSTLAELAALLTECGSGKQLGASRLEVAWLEEQHARDLDGKVIGLSKPWGLQPEASAVPGSLDRRFWVYLSVCIPAADFASSPLAAALMARRRGPADTKLRKAPGNNQAIRFVLARVDADLPRSFMLSRVARMKYCQAVTTNFRLVGPGITIDLGEGRFSRAWAAGGSQPLAAQAIRGTPTPAYPVSVLNVPNKANRPSSSVRGSGKARAEVQEGEACIQAVVAEGAADCSRWSLKLAIRTSPGVTGNLMATQEELETEAEGTRAKPSKRTVQDESNMGDLCALLQDILLMGRGLFVGPDCDGALNFCDSNLTSVLSEDEAAAVAACSIAVGGSSQPEPPGDEMAEEDDDSTVTASPHSPLRLPPVDGLPEWLFSLPQLFSGSNLSDDYPAVTMPQAIRSVPKPFQLQGLEWMLQRERKGEAAGRSLLRLFPGWLQFVTQQGIVFYMFTPRGRDCPLLSNSFLAAPTGGTCGGFLCDEMGLGKTLESLMLVLSNPAPPGWALSTEDITAELSAYSKALQAWKVASGQAGDGATGRGKRTSRPTKKTFQERQANLLKIDNGVDVTEPKLNLQHPMPVRTTLVIIPGNLMRQWQQEVRRHVHDGALKWGEYDELSAVMPYAPRDEAISSAGRQESSAAGTSRVRTSNAKNTTTIPTCKVGSGESRAPLMDLDIVFLSYERMRKEVANTRSPLLKFGFWRIMLDEAQLVANSNSVAAVNASQLWRRHAWVVTGTPVSSRLDEISGLCEFLALQPFSNRTTWETQIGGRHRERHFGGLAAIRGLLKGVMLRRTKEHVGNQLEMPPCTFVDLTIDLSQVERLFYQQMEAKLRQAIRSLKAERQAQAQAQARARDNPHIFRLVSNKVIKSTARVLGQLTSLRQCCCHPHVVRRGEITAKKGAKRHSMQEIMSNLVTKAYAEFDSAVASWLSHRSRAAAVEDILMKDQDALGAGLRAVLSEVQAHGALVTETDIRRQGRVRGLDGAINVSQPLEPKQELFLDDNAAKDRRRRYKRLELDIHIYTGYCIHTSWPRALASLVQPAERPADSEEPPSKRPKQGGGEQAEEPAEPAERPKRPAARSAGPSAAPVGNSESSPAVPEVVSAMLRQEMAEEAALRADLGLEPISFLDAVASKEVRKSRRQAGMEAEETPAKSGSRKRPTGPPIGDDQGSRQQPEPIVILDTQEEEAIVLSASEDSADAGRSRMTTNCLSYQPRPHAKRPRTETDEQVLMRSELCMRELLLLLRRGQRDKQKAVDSAAKAVSNARAEMQKKWHALQHLLNEEEEQLKLTAAEPQHGTGPGAKERCGNQATGAGQGAGAADAEDSEEGPVCPICLDVPKRRTVTSCGHSFCAICATEIMNTSMKCAICRKLLTKSDLFSEASLEELEEEAREEQLREASAAAAGDFGSKVSTLLTELDSIAARDPQAKSLVFSTWGRLLSLVGHALTARDISYVALFGTSPEARRQALENFAADSSCRVMLLLMNNSSGAAGLTLTHATHAFLLEPALSPGLEAQAAARIYRLGQTMPTRVVRLIARDTVEQRVLDLQKAKSQAGGKAQGRQQGGASTSSGDAGDTGGDEADRNLGPMSNDIDSGVLMQFFDI